MKMSNSSLISHLLKSGLWRWQPLNPCLNVTLAISDLIFPKNENLQRQWVDAMKRVNSDGTPWTPGPSACICSQHFNPDDYVYTFGRRSLKADAVPSNFQWSEVKRNQSKMTATVNGKTVALAEAAEQSTNSMEYSGTNIMFEDSRPTSCVSSSSTMSTPHVNSEPMAADHHYVLQESPRSLLKKNRQLQNKLNFYRKQYYIKSKKNRDLAVKHKIALQKLEHLRQQNAKALRLSELPIPLRRSGASFNEKQKEFATTLHFYGPKAYRYVRKTFKKCLPDPRTISRWLSEIKVKPGFLDHVFETLQRNVAAASGHQYHVCSLVLDSMSIKQHLEFDSSNNKFHGLVDLGNGQSCDKLAKEMLMLMIVGITGHWKIPIGYFLTAGLTGSVQGELVLEAIRKLHSIGIRCLSVVMDGHATNQSMVNYLGGSLNPDNLSSTFPHPCNNLITVYMLFDAAHLIKLVRNALHHYKVLYLPGKQFSHKETRVVEECEVANDECVVVDSCDMIVEDSFVTNNSNTKNVRQVWWAGDYDSEPMDFDDDEKLLFNVHEVTPVSEPVLLVNDDPHIVEWRYFEMLNDLQNREGLKAGNKLSNKHIHFELSKMKVRLATQLFSHSVADSLKYLRQNAEVFPDFRNTIGTEEFIYRIDELFDVMNSRSPVGNGTKAPIKLANFPEKMQSLSRAKEFLLGLQCRDGQRLCTSKRKMCAVGFAFNICSLQLMSTEIFDGDQNETNIRYLLTYKLSSDHLELFFSCVRARMQSNNNPTAKQLVGILRALLSRAGVSATSSANCQPLDETSLVPLCCNDNEECRAETIYCALSLRPSSESVCVDTEAPFLSDHNYLPTVGQLSIFVSDVVEYIAGWVVRKLLPQMKCAECIAAVVMPVSDAAHARSDSLLLIKDRGGLIKPTPGTVRLVSAAERLMREVSSSKTDFSDKNCNSKRLELRLLESAPDSNVLFPDSSHHFMNTFNGLDSHFSFLVRSIARIYFTVRLHHLACQFNSLTKRPSVRQKYTKAILFAHD